MTTETVLTCAWCGGPLMPAAPAVCESCLVAFRIELAYTAAEGHRADADAEADALLIALGIEA